MRAGRGSSLLWLVKSSGKIIGPYSDRQIGDLLRERVIVPIDEVSPPNGRWNYLRDVPQFAKMVEDLRIRNLLGPGDNTTTMGEDDFADSRTATVTPLALDDRTQEISQANIKSVHFVSTDDPVRVGQQKDIFTHEGDHVVRQKSNETARWLWVITILVILISGSVMIFRQQVAQPIRNKVVFEEQTNAAMESLESGEYEKALESFKRAHAIDPDDKSIYLYLGILYTQLEQQSVAARKLFEKLIESGSGDLKRVYAGIGLTYLADGSFIQAESQFTKALDLDGSYKPATINLGATAYLTENWSKAEKYFMQSMRSDKAEGIEILMLIEVLIKLFESDKETRHLEEAQRFLNEYLARSQLFRLEMKLAETYLASLKGETAKVYAAIDSILDMDFFETDDHRQNLFIYRGLVNWQKLSQWCLKMGENLDPNSHVIAFESMCLLKAGDLPGANRKIDDAMAQTPKDPTVLAAYAVLLYAMNATDRLAVISEKVLTAAAKTKLQQPLRVNARYCQMKGDYSCQSKFWFKLLELEPNSLAGLACLAQVELHDERIPEAKKYLIKGLALSSSYRPFYKLSKSISSSEDLQKAKGL